MSVFRVRLSNDGTTSIQKTASITGPNRVTRVLNDGDVFTDSNYFKRFAFPQVPLSEALLVVEVDDGSVYSDNPSENNTLAVYASAGWPSTTSTDLEIDFVADNGGPAAWMNIDNTSGVTIEVELNGNASSTFFIQANDSFAFDNGELLISSVKISGSSYSVQVLAGVRVGG